MCIIITEICMFIFHGVFTPPRSGRQRQGAEKIQVWWRFREVDTQSKGPPQTYHDRCIYWKVSWAESITNGPALKLYYTCFIPRVQDIAVGTLQPPLLSFEIGLRYAPATFQRLMN